MLRFKKYSLLVVFAMFAASVQGQDNNVCSNLETEIQRLQKVQFEMRPPADQQNNLFALMRDYDQKLATLSIVEGFYNLNRKLREQMKGASDKYKKLGKIVDYVEDAASDESLQTMRTMAAMDGALKQLQDKAELKIDATTSVEQIVTACAGKTGIALCDALNSSNNNQTTAAVQAFLQAYTVQNSGTDPTVTANRIKSYQSILKEGFTNPDFEKLYNNALKLKESSAALARLDKVENLKKDDGAVLGLKRAMCCSYSSGDLAEKDSKCKSSEAFPFKFSQCSKYIEHAEGNIAEAMTALTDYQKETHNAFNFKFDQAVVNADNKQKNAEFANLVSPQLFQTKKQAIIHEVESTVTTIDEKQQALDQLTNSIKSNIVALHRRGKIGVSDQDAQDVEKFLNSDDKIGHRMKTDGTEKKLDEDDYKAIAEQVNQTMIDKFSCMTGTTCSVKKFVEVDPYPDANNNTLYRFKLVNGDVLDQLLKEESQKLILKEFEDIKEEVATAKAKIDKIKNSNEYAHLDQIKNFLVWDMENRCSSEPVFHTQTVFCHDGTALNELDHFVTDMGVILAETDPAVIANNDLTNAGLAQRRVILSNMRGACLGLERLEKEQPGKGFSSNTIKASCERIDGMYTQANEETNSERNERLEKSGYSYDGDGRIKKRPSTWSDIATGAAKGLPNAVGTIATPFFSGIALRNSIPNQEAYWKQMKLNNYAQQWWMKNTPQYPFGMYNPYYYPNYSGYDFNFGNQTSLNTAAGGFEF